MIFLVADNHSWIVRLMRHFIVTKFGDNVQVETAKNGAEAIDKFRMIVAEDNHRRLHSVLVGCHMPVCSGIDVVYEIRRIEAACNVLRPVAVIGSSAAMCEELSEQFIAAGATYAFPKPIDRVVLVAVYDEITASSV